MAWRSIRERGTRSALTIIGIVIGISAVVSMISIGDGTNAYINEQFESLGGNTIIVSSFSFNSGGPPVSGESLRERDVDLVMSVRGVKDAMPIIFQNLKIQHKDVSVSSFVIGLDPNDAETYFKSASLDVETGRWLRTNERHSIVLGSLAAEKNFGTELGPRDKLTIKSHTFEVVGIMKEIGNSQDDSQVYIPIDTMKDLTNEGDRISAIYAIATDAGEVEEVADAIQLKLDNRYGEETFAVFSTTSLANQITAITNTLSIALGAIAGIALIVAGIGIANTMYMSILERTKEIGIMKAIGASSSNILKIFLIEAGIIGMIGGLLGLALGTAISLVLGSILEAQGLFLKTVVTPQLALMSVAFSFVVGLISGYLPSRSASRLDPIIALRYE